MRSRRIMKRIADRTLNRVRTLELVGTADDVDTIFEGIMEMERTFKMWRCNTPSLVSEMSVYLDEEVKKDYEKCWKIAVGYYDMWCMSLDNGDAKCCLEMLSRCINAMYEECGWKDAIYGWWN